MRILIFLAVFFIVPAQMHAQVAPGAVKGMSQWFITDQKDNVAFFRSNIPGNTTTFSLSTISPVGWLNQFPSLVFNGDSKLPVTLNNIDLSKSSLFTVYHSYNISTENIIWYLSKEQKPEMVLTTSRMADLDDYRYMNFIDRFPLNPKVNSYIQNKIKDSSLPLSQILHIGYKPEFPELPVKNFKGLIPEIIIYDSVLSWKDQLKVSSYLALKYAVTLTEPTAAYLNSAGDKIWDGESYSKYHNNIAGIARDDSSGLFQKKSSSSNNPGLLSVSTNDSLLNNSFLLWGDNELPLSIAEKKSGTPLMLQKNWVMIPSGLNGIITTDLILDTKQIDAQLPAKPVYWIAIDRTGKGDFSLPGTEFIKMSQLDALSKAHFNGVNWNKPGDYRTVFGFIAGQDLLMSAYINAPSCINHADGQLDIKAWGGTAPYQLKISKNNTPFADYEMTGQSLSVPGIAAGKYIIYITDKFKHSYIDSFYVNNIDGPTPASVAGKYILYDGRAVEIDASQQMPAGISYTWKGPAGFYSTNPRVSIKTPGLYTLICSRNGCEYLQDVEIMTAPKGVFNNINVYPNPSDGLFTIKVSLDKKAPVVVDIYTVEGRLVSSKKLEGFANYSYTENINGNGLYYLVFRSGLSKATWKQVIIK